MYKASHTKNKIYSVLTSANNVNDLLPLLKHIPIDQIKQLIKQNVDKMNTKSIRNIHLNSLSIHETIPDDLIQHILSFHSIDEINMKLVNKKWRKLFESNERNYYLQLIQRLDQDSPIKYDPRKNQTWIINQTRYKLTKRERELGFIGPILGFTWNNIHDQIKKGDRLFVHSGKYLLDDKIPENTSVIGIGNVKMIVHNSVNHFGTFYMENIYAFVNQQYHNGMHVVYPNNKLVANKCKFFNGIYVLKNASLNITDCQFITNSNAIKISVTAKQAIINDCIFNKCAKTCIEIVPSQSVQEDEIALQLKCNDNIFKNNKKYPIAEKPKSAYITKPVYIEKEYLYELKNNILTGYNGTSVLKDVTDANSIYFNDDKGQIILRINQPPPEENEYTSINVRRRYNFGKIKQKLRSIDGFTANSIKQMSLSFDGVIINDDMTLQHLVDEYNFTNYDIINVQYQ